MKLLNSEMGNIKFNFFKYSVIMYIKLNRSLFMPQPFTFTFRKKTFPKKNDNFMINFNEKFIWTKWSNLRQHFYYRHLAKDAIINFFMLINS